MVRKVFGTVLVVLVFGFSPPISVSLAGPVVWYDGGKTGDFSSGWDSPIGNWQIVQSAQAAHSGPYGFDITGSTEPDDDILSIPISTTDWRDLILGYAWRIRSGLEGSDYVVIEWSQNGGKDWNELTSYSNLVPGEWQLAEFVLPEEASNNPDFAFRLRARLSSGGDRMAFDDFSLTGQLVPEPTTIAFMVAGSLILWRFRRQD